MATVEQALHGASQDGYQENDQNYHEHVLDLKSYKLHCRRAGTAADIAQTDLAAEEASFVLDHEQQHVAFTVESSGGGTGVEGLGDRDV